MSNIFWKSLLTKNVSHKQYYQWRTHVCTDTESQEKSLKPTHFAHPCRMFYVSQIKKWFKLFLVYFFHSSIRSGSLNLKEQAFFSKTRILQVTLQNTALGQRDLCLSRRDCCISLDEKPHSQIYFIEFHVYCHKKIPTFKY